MYTLVYITLQGPTNDGPCKIVLHSIWGPNGRRAIQYQDGIISYGYAPSTVRDWKDVPDSLVRLSINQERFYLPQKTWDRWMVDPVQVV